MIEVKIQAFSPSSTIFSKVFLYSPLDQKLELFGKGLEHLLLLLLIMVSV